MTNREAKMTGKAWGISYKRVKKLHNWVAFKIPAEYQSLVFTKLLRRYKDSNK